MGGSKQGPGQGAKLGDFAWVDTVMVEVDRRGLPAAMARKGRVPRATVQVGEGVGGVVLVCIIT